MAHSGYLLPSHRVGRQGAYPPNMTTAPPRKPNAVVAAVTERRSRSARVRRRRRQAVLWFIVAVLVGTVTFGAGLLAGLVLQQGRPVHQPLADLFHDNFPILTSD